MTIPKIDVVSRFVDRLITDGYIVEEMHSTDDDRMLGIKHPTEDRWLLLSVGIIDTGERDTDGEAVR